MKKVVLILLASAAAVFAGTQVINFDSAAIGTVPAGWTVAMTHADGAP